MGYLEIDKESFLSCPEMRMQFSFVQRGDMQHYFIAKVHAAKKKNKLSVVAAWLFQRILGVGHLTVSQVTIPPFFGGSPMEA